MVDRNSEWESENQNVSGEPCRANVGRGLRDMWVGRLKMLCLEKGISVHNVLSAL